MANQPLPVNNQTQAVLSKYGITAPKKITNIQNIQNKTETDIKIVQPNINVSAPNIQINPVEIAIQRYKNWVENAYGRQKVLASKQKQDLEEKDYELRKSLNRVFRKIEDLRGHIIEKSRGFKKKLDSSMSSLVPIFIAALLPVIWTPLMKRIESIEQGFRYLFFGEIPPGMSDNPDSFTFARTIRQFLGMDDSEGKSLFQGIGDLISEGVDKIVDFLEIQKEDRFQAVQEVLKKPAPGFSWGDLLSAKEKLGENFEYLGDIMTALFGGSGAIAERQSKKDATNNIEKDNNKEKGKWGSGKYIKKAIKSKTPAASYYLSDQAVKYINSKDSIDVEKLQLLFNEISKLAENDNAFVSENFLNTFLGEEKTQELQKIGKITQQNIVYDRRNKKDDETRNFLNESYKNDLFKNSERSRPNGYGSRSTSGDTKNATIAYKIDKSVIPELFEGIESGSSLYDQKNYSTFRKSIQNIHKTVHGEDISNKAILKESANKFHEINEQTKKKLQEWETSDKYTHLNNFGTYSGRNTGKDEGLGFKLSNNSDALISNNELSGKIVEQAEKDMGRITYKYGELGYNKTDCSGYISNVYKKFGVNVPNGSINICKDANEGQKAKWIDVSEDPYSAYRQGTYEPNWDKLQPGDIMVWSRYGSDHTNDRANYSYAGHVSLYTGKKDEQGNPIILGHSGPGPDSDKPEVKGTKREGLNDLRSYLGTVRYNMVEASKTNATATGEKGDPGDDETKEPEPKKSTPKITPTKEENDTIPMIDSIVPKEKQFPMEADYFLAENNKPTSIIPEISEKVSEQEKEGIGTSIENNRNKYYTDILNNVTISLANCATSVELKKAHAKEMMG